MSRLLAQLYTRECRGCDDTTFHTHHLTRLGSWHYARIARRPFASRVKARSLAISIMCFIVAGLDVYVGATEDRHGYFGGAALIALIGALNLWVHRANRRSS